MKKVIFKPFITTVAVFLSLSLLFSSCKKDEVTLPDAAIVTFAHGSPKSPRLDLALDKNRLNISNFTYTSYWNNQRAYIGNRTLSVYRRGENTALFTKALSFEKDKHYTVFLVDSLSKMDAVLLQNTTRAAGADSVRVKFANMSPDVPAMDFYIKGQSEPVATNVAYKSGADFISIKAGYDQVIEVRQTGQPTVLAASLPVTFATGHIYTIWSSGFKGIPTGEGRIVVSNIRHTNPVYWY